MSLFKINEVKRIENPTCINLRLDVKDRDELKDYAKEENLNISNFIRKCINFYLESLDNNKDDGVDDVDDIDYLIDYKVEFVDPDFTCDQDLSNRKGYHVDDDGYEYFMGKHNAFEYTDPIELRRTPQKLIEFRLLDDDRGFVPADDYIRNANFLD